MRSLVALRCVALVLRCGSGGAPSFLPRYAFGARGGGRGRRGARGGGRGRGAQGGRDALGRGRGAPGGGVALAGVGAARRVGPSAAPVVASAAAGVVVWPAPCWRQRRHGVWSARVWGFGYWGFGGWAVSGCVCGLFFSHSLVDMYESSAAFAGGCGGGGARSAGAVRLCVPVVACAGRVRHAGLVCGNVVSRRVGFSCRLVHCVIALLNSREAQTTAVSTNQRK